MRYLLFVALLSYGLLQSADGQEERPILSSAQQGNKTIFLLSGIWTTDSANTELLLSTSSTIKNVKASDWWDISARNDSRALFSLSENTNSTSFFVINTNETSPTFEYRLRIGETEHAGELKSSNNSDARWYVGWTDSREGALTAFLPEGWKADLQVVRPYNSMTGFVFFVRGEENALAYVFYPFMPLHVLPVTEICDTLGTCDGIASTQEVQKSHFGNAPVAISHLKTPQQYFQSEILPLLRANLDGYAVQSTSPVFALKYDNNNNPGTEFSEGLQVNYSFDAQGQRVIGKAAVFITNYTATGSGFWNGVVIGVESSEANFDEDFRRAAVSLLTLQLDEDWMANEQKVLDSSASLPSPALRNVTAVMSNTTLADFNSVISTSVHALVRSHDGTQIAAYIDTDTERQMHLPVHESSRHWYLSDERLLERKVGRNIMNKTVIEPLHR